MTPKSHALVGLALSLSLCACRPPVAQNQPTLTGDPVERSTLTVDPGTSPVPFTVVGYQWQRCETPASCVDIPQATASNYTLQAADVDNTVKAKLTEQISNVLIVVVSSPSATVRAAPPMLQTAPLLSGGTTEGATVSGTTGTWASSRPPTFVQQWRRCNSAGNACVDLPGATSLTYAIASADVGGTLRLHVIATNSGGSAAADSLPLSIPLVLPVNTQLPVITGVARAGDTLHASTGTWTEIGRAHV